MATDGQRITDGQFRPPDWYDETKLRRAYFAKGYTGWVIDLGDGTCRFANQPLLGENGPNWGDRVPLEKGKDGLAMIIASQILERYDPETDRIQPKEGA